MHAAHEKVELGGARRNCRQLSRVNARTNHVHVVITAPGNRASRHLSDHAGLSGQGKNGRKRWWTEKGDIEFTYDEIRLAEVVKYVNEMQ